MAILKPSRAILAAKVSALDRAKRERKAALIIAEGENSPLWRGIQAKIKPLIEDAEARLIEWERHDDRILHGLLATKAAYTRVYNMVADIGAGVDIYNNQIAALEKDIEESRARV